MQRVLASETDQERVTSECIAVVQKKQVEVARRVHSATRQEKDILRNANKYLNAILRISTSVFAPPQGRRQ